MTERLGTGEALEAPQPLPNREDYFYVGPGEAEWEKTPPKKAPETPDIQDPAPRATGKETFDQLSKSEQDELLGEETAAKVRSGEVELSDLVTRNHTELDGDDFITQGKP